MYYSYMYEFLQKTITSSNDISMIINVLTIAAVFAGILVLIMLFSRKRRTRFRISLFLGITGVILFCVPYMVFCTN